MSIKKDAKKSNKLFEEKFNKELGLKKQIYPEKKPSFQPKKIWDKFWFIIWKDDSLKGWILSIIFIFILIKFVFFPGLSLITGTSLPLAIVESCSMYHEGNLFSDSDAWYERHEEKYGDFEINQENFSKFPFQDGFNKGDILFIVGTKSSNLEVGDVIVFSANSRNPVIHRIINIEEGEDGRIISTIGDNNGVQLSSEKKISEDKILGRAVLKIAPYFGWVKLIFFEPLRHISERGLCYEN
ncbi:MAG: signal peptidase I [Candidatus Pacearchaeota archaeon]